MAKQKVQTPNTVYVDRPEVAEIYVDGLENMRFEGAALKIEFVVHRWDNSQAPKIPTARKYPACRLVVSPNAAMDLYTKLGQLMAALESQGVIKRTPPAADAKAKLAP